MADPDSTLAVVMPAYNEAGAIATVMAKWMAALDALGADYQFHVYNDGSRDDTLACARAAAGGHPRVHVHTHPNRGHGPTILRGYREQADHAWIFQLDADDEMEPDALPTLWAHRDRFDLVIGRRTGRNSPAARALVSATARWVVRAFYGGGVYDVNSPYRLMRTAMFRDWFARLPDNTFAPNVILAGLAARHRLRIVELPVAYHFRTTGVVSIRKGRLLRAALRAWGQTIAFSFRASG